MTPAKQKNGFPAISHPSYPERKEVPLLAASTMAEGGMPGSDYLWVGRDHHLNREEVAALIGRLCTWLETGQF